MNRDDGRKIVAERVEEFERSKAVLTKKGHGETNIRSNFIDVLFRALGWDMKNHYEVVREYSQRDRSTGGGTKKVDYAFKINGALKFFIEAKEASVDLERDRGAIYQAKRYAYSSNGRAPIVILTDFEEFRVFNVIRAPLPDNPDRELLKTHSMRYTDYLEKWDLLWDSFSREAVAAGSLDALRGRIDKNTRTMDVDFLEQITAWRETLARNIALRNKELSVDEINEAVQRILDRLIFIRNLEDREIEQENTLLDKTKGANDVYRGVVPVFHELDRVYNGLLFKRHFSEELAIDDKTMKDIVKSMCYPVSPFQFDVIEPEILGRIYEKFLGSKIRLTENHQAKIEEKPEVRKAGGVYYTPEYIVQYIVENTVGKKIENLTPEGIKSIKIIDPACGSGSFLLGAYSYLLEYHRKWYAVHRPDGARGKDYYVTREGETRVSLEKRGDILRNNIFGVDIDKEATEVAIMSLYLKMFDDGFDRGERDLFFVKGHVLPDMTDNVKCGNSLVGTDYFDGKLDFDMEEMKQIKPLDWEKEFAGIISEGGFDCVIGNPPYVRQETLGSAFKDYAHRVYKAYHGIADLYVYFIEKAFSLVKEGGYLSYIVANKWMRANYGQPLRVWMAGKNIEEIIDFGDLPVFQGATTYPCIVRLKKSAVGRDFLAVNVGALDFQSLPGYVAAHGHRCSYDQLNPTGWSLTDGGSHALLEKLKRTGVPLSEYVNGKIFYGIKTGLNEAFVLDGATRDRLISEDPKSADIIKPFLMGRDIKRYVSPVESNYLILFPRGYTNQICSHRNNAWNCIQKEYPAIARYLSQFENKAKARYDQGDYWWELRACDYYEEFEKPKIIIPAIVQNASYMYDENCFYSNDKTSIIPIDDLYLLGLLNSKVPDFVMHNISSTKQGGYYEYKPMYVSQLPIRTIDFNIPDEKTAHDAIVSLVNQMLRTQQELRAAKSESDRKLYEQKISMLDAKIDELVYRLYGLTDEEVRIVEGTRP